MKISNEDLLTQFIKENPEITKGMDRQEVKLVCHNPWACLKDEMKSGRLTKVRMQYFGTFQVYIKKAQSELDRLTKQFKKHEIEPKLFFRLQEMLTRFLTEGTVKNSSVRRRNKNKTYIEDLDISYRLYSCLKSLSIKYAEDLDEKLVDRFKGKFSNSRKCLEELEKIVNEKNI